MKSLIALILLFASTIANAHQSTTELMNPQLSLTDSNVILTGTAYGKRYSQQVNRAQVTGFVSGVDCGLTQCSGVFSLKRNGEVHLFAQVDSDNDGNLDASETLRVGRFNSDGSISMTAKARYLLVEETYSILEKLAAARDRKYLTVEIEN